MKNIIVTIDGPAASGKEKIAKYISKKFKLIHLDSGVLYRRIALIFLKENVNINSYNEIKRKLLNIKTISFRNHKNLRIENISKYASKIAVYKEVRKFVNKLQYEYVHLNIKKSGFVIDGRDIGSKVFRKADIKLYIEVNTENRAKRRYKQLIDTGEKSIYPQILKEIKLRDKKDINRKHSPLVIPKGAFKINNNNSFAQTIKNINNIFENYNYESRK